MRLVILYNDDSLMPPLNDYYALWVSVLIADKIDYHGAFTCFYWMYEMFHNSKKEEKKVMMCLQSFSGMYEGLNVDVDKVCEDFKLFYDSLKMMRKKKGKTKQMVIHLMEGEKRLKEIFGNVSNYIKSYSSRFGLNQLSNHVNYDGKDFMIFYDDLTLTFDKHPENILDQINSYFSDEDSLFISDDCVEKVSDKENGFVSFELIDFPYFEYLNEPQYMEFRKEFLKENDLFNDVIPGLKFEMNGKDFTDENVLRMKDVIREKLDTCRYSLQERLNDCVNRFTDIPETSIRNMLCLGFTSRERFLELYNAAKIFTDEMFPYVKEHLVREVDLKRMVPFLYLRVEGERDVSH